MPKRLGQLSRFPQESRFVRLAFRRSFPFGCSLGVAVFDCSPRENKVRAREDFLRSGIGHGAGRNFVHLRLQFPKLGLRLRIGRLILNRVRGFLDLEQSVLVFKGLDRRVSDHHNGNEERRN